VVTLYILPTGDFLLFMVWMAFGEMLLEVEDYAVLTVVYSITTQLRKIFYGIANRPLSYGILYFCGGCIIVLLFVCTLFKHCAVNQRCSNPRLQS
jgi:hypothetical protein